MYQSMSTQEKALMSKSEAASVDILNLSTESTSATVRQIAKDFIELYRLENKMSSLSKNFKSQDEANSIAQEIAIDLIELEVKLGESKVFTTISRVDENGLGVPIGSSRLTTTASTDHVGDSKSVSTRSIVDRGIQFKTYFV